MDRRDYHHIVVALPANTKAYRREIKSLLLKLDIFLGM